MNLSTHYPPAVSSASGTKKTTHKTEPAALLQKREYHGIKILLKVGKSMINSTKLLLELCYCRPMSMDHGGLSEKEKEGKNTNHHMPI